MGTDATGTTASSGVDPHDCEAAHYVVTNHRPGAVHLTARCSFLGPDTQVSFACRYKVIGWRARRVGRHHLNCGGKETAWRLPYISSYPLPLIETDHLMCAYDCTLIIIISSHASRIFADNTSCAGFVARQTSLHSKFEYQPMQSHKHRPSSSPSPSPIPTIGPGHRQGPPSRDSSVQTFIIFKLISRR